jgi:hypothetical protein
MPLLTYPFHPALHRQATIMTDPETASRTYVGPMTPECVEDIIAKVGPRRYHSPLQAPH